MQNQCIRINQIKLPVQHDQKALEDKIRKLLNLRKDAVIKYQIVKKSIDARNKPDIRFVYSVDIESEGLSISKKVFGQTVSLIQKQNYHYEITGKTKLAHAPVIVGMGPAGLFCGYYLARNGYHPIIIERGEDVDRRQETVNLFWETGKLNTESNVQFGEGGAGTFSDGKLNTQVKDKTGRNHEVLETFIKFGAKEEIRYINKPHIGTDMLKQIVKRMREEICRLGGTICFHTKMTDFCMEETGGNKRITGVWVNRTEKLETGFVKNRTEKIETNILVLAIGHSARDTFEVLRQRVVVMSPKAFAVGLRMEHPQTMINRAMYGTDIHEVLEAADYKVTYQTSKRGIYSFCMCPGGYVVNASSEEGKLAVNGMSYSDRTVRNSNSAIVASVSPVDYGKGVLDGIKFQQKLEKLAFLEGNGAIPVQRFDDFCQNRRTEKFGKIYPAIKGKYCMGNLRNVLPKELSQELIEGIHGFARQIPDFDRGDALLSGVESRTSSPVRLERDEQFFSRGISGLYPCGEGAGYAGGITSAAMDGLRIFEAIIREYAPLERI